MIAHLLRRQPLSQNSVAALSRRLALALAAAGCLLGYHPAQLAGAPAGSFLETVKVPAGYAVGKYEVTQAQYEAIMGKNPSAFKGPRKPVESVSWENAMSFCKKLTESEHQAGRLPASQVYTLPTVKQWSYFSAGTSLDDAVTSLKTRRNSTENVGSLHPNKFGLYDVRGNVWEWCLDSDGPDSDARMIVGGAFANSEPEKLALNYEFALTPLFKIAGVGFRCVIVTR